MAILDQSLKQETTPNPLLVFKEGVGGGSFSSILKRLGNVP